MAFEEYDDYEQEQLVKEWLNKNWLTIVAGIALGIGGLWGYGQWQVSQSNNIKAAAEEFVQIEQLLSLGELTEAEKMIADYEAQYGSNIYVVKARLMAAGKLVEQDKIAEAKVQYQTLIDAKPEKSIAEMARLRLARLLVSEGDYTAALTHLDKVQSQAYQTIVEEVVGDVFLAQGELNKAKDAYQLALNEGEGYSGRQIVEMKLADVKAAK
ncbi:YfgM family protein [Marinicella litoralis]|uniref:Ancillary SecYEG translocon subunit n=1 Tax=Marinicella litoralis TaxID=644220 RepID=A0A4R6XVM3_9GAMM|nr:tetratricopeptide repeat protein [Marinicella litoralis]TDR22460.1 putative negative regulator of RcsB-dependent stress response [Marinicella litoralis]